jgi:hypothetical protein
LRTWVAVIIFVIIQAQQDAPTQDYLLVVMYIKWSVHRNYRSEIYVQCLHVRTWNPTGNSVTARMEEDVESLTKQAYPFVDSSQHRQWCQVGRAASYSERQESYGPPVLVRYKSPACLVRPVQSRGVPHKQLSNLTGLPYFPILCLYSVCEGRLNLSLFHMNKNKCLPMFLIIGCSKILEVPKNNMNLQVKCSRYLKILYLYTFLGFVSTFSGSRALRFWIWDRLSSQNSSLIVP